MNSEIVKTISKLNTDKMYDKRKTIDTKIEILINRLDNKLWCSKCKSYKKEKDIFRIQNINLCIACYSDILYSDKNKCKQQTKQKN